MSEGVDDPRQEALGEIALARLALDQDDLGHCADHVAAALTHEPALPEAHELLESLAVRTSDGGLELFPLDQNVYIGRLIGHAHLLARSGEPTLGLALLAQASAHDPGMPWADVPWVHGLDPSRVEPADLTQIYVRLLSGLPDKATDTVKAASEVYIGLAQRAVAAYPDEPVLHGALSGVARRLGDVRQALRWAQRGVELESNMLTEMWYANALYANGQPEAAIVAMEAAGRHDPDNLSIKSDLALWMFEAGRRAEALGLIDAAIAQDPSYDCAVFTAHRLRFGDSGDPEHLVAIADFQREHTEQSHEHHELAICSDGLPWLGHVPPASEACINGLRQLKPEHRTMPGEIGISSMEAPSALMTVYRMWPGTKVAMSEPGAPDPRVPLRPGVQLWKFNGVHATAALPAPSASSVDTLTHFAGMPWSPPPALYDLAVNLSAIPVDDLLALLVHPPEPPSPEWDETPSLWERSVQVWCCLGLLHHRTDEPWLTSQRRRLLVEIAYGVEDWTTEAALFALATAAWVDPSCRSDVARLVETRFKALVEAGRTRAVTIGVSVAQLAFITPGVSGATRRMAWDYTKHDRRWPGIAPYRGTQTAPPPPGRRSLWSRLTGRE